MDAHEWTAAAAGCAADHSVILSCRPAWHLQDTLDRCGWATDLCFGVWTEFILIIDFYNKCRSHHSILCKALATLTLHAEMFELTILCRASGMEWEWSGRSEHLPRKVTT